LFKQRHLLAAVLSCTVLTLAPAMAQDKPAPGAEKKSEADLISQARQLEAQRWVLRAEEAAKQENNLLALELYRRALQMDSSNESAQKGVRDTQAKLTSAPSTSVGNDQVTTVALSRQQAIAHYNRAMTKARKEAKQANFSRSLDNATYARAILDQNRASLAEAEYEQMRQMSLNLSADIKKQEANHKGHEREVQQVAIKKDAERRQVRLERERERKIQTLLRLAADLRRDLKYESSLEKVEELLFIDPNNIAGQAMKEMIEEALLARKYDQIVSRRVLEQAKHQLENEMAIIPFRDVIVYPPDWPQLSLLRQRITGGPTESEATRRVQEKLKLPIAVNFDANTFEGVIEYLRNVTGLDLFVNWRALELAGVDRNAQLSLKLNQVPAGKALSLILQQVGGDAVKLDYSIDDGVVQISTVDNLGQNTIIRSYDIRDLLVNIPNFTDAPEFDLDSVIAGDPDSGSTGSPFDDAAGADSLTDDSEERIQQITDLIRNTVQPTSWDTVGAINELNGTLIIRQTGAAHRSILDLLGQLRETRALQINIEARFLFVDHNFLEEIGVDIDFEFGGVGGIGPVTVRQNHINLATATSTGLVPGSFGAGALAATSVPTPGVDGIGASPGVGTVPTARGLQLNAFLNDTQVDLMIRATQAKRTSTTLHAPRLTFMNGQRAYVLIARQVAFISDLEPVVAGGGGTGGTGIAAFDPEISVVNSGVVLDVEGTVSADRRYVTLTARPSLATLPPGGFRQLPVFAGAAATFVELPEMELTTVRTTVSVPDKGTLLMGGMRLLGDVEIEAGVPMLSKIPLINRAFTNRSNIKDERTLLVLIKPQILIQSEIEDSLHPGMNQSIPLFGGAPIGRPEGP
jgi:type II secretory pathway component GspD/PulD (secretin)